MIVIDYYSDSVLIKRAVVPVIVIPDIRLSVTENRQKQVLWVWLTMGSPVCPGNPMPHAQIESTESADENNNSSVPIT